MPLVQYLGEKQVGQGFKGELFQKGYGHGLPSFQRGRGLGSLVSKIKSSPFLSKFKKKLQFVAKPILKKVIAKTKPYAKQLGKKIAESALDVGKESLKDIVINRKSPKEVVKNKSNELKRKIIGATSDTLKLMEGKGYSSHVKRTKTEQKQSKKIKNQKKKVHKPKKNNKKNKKKNRKSGKVVKTGKKTIKNKVKAGKKPSKTR